MNEIEKAIEYFMFQSKNQEHSKQYMRLCALAALALEAQQADRWIPCEEQLPELEYIKNIWVTARKKGYDHRIVMHIRWDYRRFQHPNGKEISDTWEILAWKLTEYPEPYDPLAEKIQAALDRVHERISGGKSK